MNLNFTIFYIIFLVISSIYRLSMRAKILSIDMESGKIYAKWTLHALFISYILIIILTVGEYFICKREINFVVTIVGLIFYISGLVGRDKCAKTLGKYWSPHVEIRNKQKLIREGIYKYMRHPYYFFFLFEVGGFTLIPNTYYSFLFTLSLYLLLFLIRIHCEEKALINKFGEEYINYKKEVHAFLPIPKRFKK